MPETVLFLLYLENIALFVHVDTRPVVYSAKALQNRAYPRFYHKLFATRKHAASDTALSNAWSLITGSCCNCCGSGGERLHINSRGHQSAT